MVNYISVRDGHEEGVYELIEISEGMEKHLQRCVDYLLDGEPDKTIEISYGSMSDEKYREVMIDSIVYGECCTREEAIKILEEK